MEFLRRPDKVNSLQKKGQKRKLDEDFIDGEQEISSPSAECLDGAQVNILNNSFSWKEADRAAAERAAQALADLAKIEEVLSAVVDGGAVPALVKHLQPATVSEEAAGVKPFEHEVEKGGAFALGLLAVKEVHNQAGIAHSGGLLPLLKLLDSNGSLQHNSPADNEDNASDFIKVGDVHRLQVGEFIVQATKDCVAKTLKRLEQKIHGRGKYSTPIEAAYLLLQMHFVLCLTVVIGFIYTGYDKMTLDIAQDLLKAADQYLLEGIKRLCEYTIAQNISLENVANLSELSDAFHALSLKHT